MYWTLELASFLSDAPWPATKDELIDYSIRTGSPLEVVENLQSIEDENMCTTDCNHEFCKECLDNWFNRHKLSCPLCRKNIEYFYVVVILPFQTN